MLNKRDDELEKLINGVKDRLKDKYFAGFINSKDKESREEIYMKTTVLNDVIFAIINEINRK